MTDRPWFPGERQKKCALHGFWVSQDVRFLPCPHPDCDPLSRDHVVHYAVAGTGFPVDSADGVDYDNLVFGEERKWVRKKFRVGDDDQAIIGWAWEEQYD